MTNRKLYTRFRLVPESVTLDDSERPLRTLFWNTCFFRAYHENLNKIDAYYQQRRCRPKALVSVNIRFVWIFSGGSRQTTMGLSTTAVLSVFAGCIHWSQNTWPWMTLNGHFTLNFLSSSSSRFTRLLIRTAPWYLWITSMRAACRKFVS